MGNTTPNNLTELKMFLRDEHVPNKLLRVHSQLKRQFEHHLTSVEPDRTQFLMFRRPAQQPLRQPMKHQLCRRVPVYGRVLRTRLQVLLISTM